MASAAPPSPPTPGDPRRSGEANVLPSVAPPRGGISGWMIAILMVVVAMVLFAVLDARRRSLTAPAVRPRTSDNAVGGGTNVAPLYVPPVIVPAPPAPVVVAPPPPPPAPPPPPQIVYVPQPPQQPVMAAPPPPPPHVAAEPALVIDAGAPTAAQGAGNASAGSGNGNGVPTTPGNSITGARTGAGTLANRSTTVPQGTLIPAVLETALNSDRAGLARAVVQRDIRSFDGTRVLIPRGSRLIGEYRSDARQGQNRMLVMWVRLIRPDGATIALGSPASDTLGGSGIKASVNTHFLERFGGAILQSALDIGVNLASRSSGSPVIVALPGTVSGAAGQITQQTQIPPTLKVKAATSISVFVARDLDFTGAEYRR